MHKKILCFLFVFISYTGLTQSKIEKAEESLKKQESSVNRVSDNDNDEDNNETFGEMLFKETVGRLFINIFAYTLYGVLIETPFEKNTPSSHAILTKRPYFNSNTGNYSYAWDDNSAAGKTTILSRYIFENATLDGNHINIDIRFYNKLALEIDYLQLWENNPNFGYDTFAFYTALGKYHRVRTKRLDGWWGLGVSYIDGSVNQFGVTYALGAEWFLVKPISIETNFNQTLLNDNTINKFNGLINYHINQYKLNGGYEHLKIGSQKFSTISLGLGVSF